MMLAIRSASLVDLAFVYAFLVLEAFRSRKGSWIFINHHPSTSLSILFSSDPASPAPSSPIPEETSIPSPPHRRRLSCSRTFPSARTQPLTLLHPSPLHLSTFHQSTKRTHILPLPTSSAQQKSKEHFSTSPHRRLRQGSAGLPLPSPIKHHRILLLSIKPNNLLISTHLPHPPRNMSHLIISSSSSSVPSSTVLLLPSSLVQPNIVPALGYPAATS